MTKYIYNLPDGKQTTSSKGGTVKGVGSFPPHWLDKQDTDTLTNWGIVKSVVPTPPPPPLPEVKEQAKKQVGLTKRREQDGSFTYNGVVFQNDPRARQLILGAVVMALLANMASAPWTIDWTAADDTTVTLNADQMIAMGIASGKQVSVLHSTARDTKGQIDSAMDAKSVQDILDAARPVEEKVTIK